MHEASLVEGILRVALDSLRDFEAANATEAPARIREIVCEAGLLACVEEATLSACFELYAEGTPAEGALLTVRRAPLECVCQECGNHFSLESRHFFCPRCQSGKIQLQGGSGLSIISINVECGELVND